MHRANIIRCSRLQAHRQCAGVLQGCAVCMGHLLYGRIGTHDKSTVWTAAVPDAGKKNDGEGGTDKENERKGGRKREKKEREREIRCCLYAAFTVSRLAIPAIPYRLEIFRSRSSSPVIDTCAHDDHPKPAREFANLYAPHVKLKKLWD